jgi:hypothetical protein
MPSPVLTMGVLHPCPRPLPPSLQDALQELSSLGLTSDLLGGRGRAAGDKFSFASSGAGTKKGGKRRNSVGRAVPPRRR